MARRRSFLYRNVQLSKSSKESLSELVFRSHPRIAFRLASIDSVASSYDRNRPQCLKDVGPETRVRTQAYRVYTNVVGDTLHGNILKGITLVCVDGWVRTDWNLAVIIGEATPLSLGNLRGWTSETRWVGGRGKFGHVLRFRKYFSVVSGYGTQSPPSRPDTFTAPELSWLRV